MTGAISIEKRVAGTSRRYVGRIDGVEGEAELLFTVRGPSLISADHTEAPASMRGTGAAMTLVDPTCSPSTGSIPSGATSWRAPLRRRSRAPRPGANRSRGEFSAGKAGDH